MEANALYVTVGSAADVVGKFAEMAGAIFSNVNVKFLATTNVEGIRVEVTALATTFKDNQQVLAFRERVSDRPHVICTRIQLWSQQQPQSLIIYDTTDGIVGKFTLQQVDEQRALAALEEIEKRFKVTPYADLLRSRGVDSVERAALQLRERSVADLQAQVERLGDLLGKITEREVEARQRLTAALENAYRGKQADLETQHLARQASLDERQKARDDEFETRVRAFEEREKEFETRQAKYVRRDLLTKIQATLDASTEAKITDETVRKRRWVHGFSWALMGFSATIVTLLLYVIVTKDNPSWHLIGPLAAASATFVTTVVYYLKWSDRWFREHAEAEFAARRYKADILRASWLAELVSELATEDRGELPPELLDAFTRNLFRAPTGAGVSEHPLDGFADLSRRIKELSIGGRGVTVKASEKRRKGGAHEE